MRSARAWIVLLGSLAACTVDEKPAAEAHRPDTGEHGSDRDTGDTQPPDCSPNDTGGSDTGPPPPRGTLVLEWSPTGTTASGQHHFAAFSPDEPHRVYLGSVRSGVFTSATDPPSFELLGPGELSPHAYSRVTFIPGSPDSMLMSGGRYLNVSRNRGENWSQIFLYGPSGDVSTDILTGLDADEVSVWIADNQGRVWESTDLGDTFSYIALIASPPVSATKHDGESGDVDSWLTEGPGLLVLGGDALLAAWDNGSVYRSADRGQTWARVLEGTANRSAMARMGEHVYVGLEDGVYRSDDDGLTFFRVDALPEHCVDLSASAERLALSCDETLWMYDGATATEISTPESVLSVALSPLDADVLLAGMYEGIMWSTDGGASTERHDDGLYANTFQSIAVDLFDPDHLIIGTRCSRGIYQTTDRAESWEYVPTGTHYVMVVAFAPSDSSRVYVTNGTGKSTGDVLRSDDGGDSFAEAAPLPDAEVAHPHGLAIHPEEADTLIVGTSVDTVGAVEVGGLFLSTDAGDTWSRIGTGLPDVESAFIAVAYDPTDPNRVFVGTGPTGTYHKLESSPGDEPSGSGAGLWVSNDGGGTFTRVGGGFEGEQVWDVEVSSAGTVFASTETGVYRSVDSGDSWTEVVPLEDAIWTQVSIAPTDPTLVAYTHTKDLGISTDGGLTWSSKRTELQDATGYAASMLAPTFSADSSELYLSLGGLTPWRGTISWHTDVDTGE